MEFSKQEHLASSGCPYPCPAGSICNKCGQEHDGVRRHLDEHPHPVGRWLAAALEDPEVCQEMKDDINSWFAAGAPSSYDDWMALKREVEQLRVQLAGCGVVAMQNTRSSVALRCVTGEYGWSASYDDVCQAVDREMELRERLEGITGNGPVGVVSASKEQENGSFFTINWLRHADLKQGSLLYVSQPPCRKNDMTSTACDDQLAAESATPVPVPATYPEPDLLWPWGDEESLAYDCPHDAAVALADGMVDDRVGHFTIHCARKLPDRTMRITLTGGDERHLEWTWAGQEEDRPRATLNARWRKRINAALQEWETSGSNASALAGLLESLVRTSL